VTVSGDYGGSSCSMVTVSVLFVSGVVFAAALVALADICRRYPLLIVQGLMCVESFDLSVP
jgi:hypothetical protein